MTLLADLLHTVFERRHRPGRLHRDARPLKDLTAALIGTKGEISGQAIACELLDRYARWSDAEKLGFFRHLADDMDVTPEAVRAALDGYVLHRSKASYRDFLTAAEAPRQELIRRLNQVPGATRRLVQMRADLLRLGRGDDALMAVDLDFRHLFASWFNRGFLVLRRISWESPALLLEKIHAYEAVHAIESWDDLRRRLQPEDRRCFAFFHPAMADEPLIFVEVALTVGVPGSIQALLADDAVPLDVERADTAVFYSISNCQPGLAGISFGNSLIKQVAADLAVEFAGLRSFVTLSPIPGLMRWLAAQGIPADPADDIRMRQLAAHYLTEARRADGMPLDPVARFHLGNGARIEAVHARADISARGLRQSGGVMVNYRYDLARLAANHETFATERHVATSSGIRALSAAASAMLAADGAR